MAEMMYYVSFKDGREIPMKLMTFLKYKIFTHPQPPMNYIRINTDHNILMDPLFKKMFRVIKSEREERVY